MLDKSVTDAPALSLSIEQAGGVEGVVSPAERSRGAAAPVAALPHRRPRRSVAASTRSRYTVESQNGKCDSLFAIRYSLFVIRYSLFATRDS